MGVSWEELIIFSLVYCASSPHDADFFLTETGGKDRARQYKSKKVDSTNVHVVMYRVEDKQVR